jgi:predicted ATPase
MIEKIRIENYRCFKDTTINFQNTTIIVGKNNAGKSTLIETLRIVSIVVNRCNNLNFQKSPDWLDMQPMYVGVSPSIANLDILTVNLFHLYGDGPAKITAYFPRDIKFEIYVGENAEIFSLIFDEKGHLVKNKNQARGLGLKAVNILPQIGPIQREENVLKYNTVQSGSDTYLASRHFRNQIKFNYKYFQKFKELAESSWPGLGIRELDGRTTFEGGKLTLIVRDSAFAAEIGWMGHGLQMWLQTMWFLAKCEPDSTVILDEPDVYMHADLQRRLIRMMKDEFTQILIATHSVEIISEVEPEQILPVNSSRKNLHYAAHTPMVQQIINNIGSVHNLEIARIFSHQKFLIVEGDLDDIKLLSIFQEKIYRNSPEPLQTVPKTYIEGWGGWQRVIGSSGVFKDNKLKIISYCILDSDYHLDEEKIERYEEAKRYSINLHIWKRKEIENYVINSAVILRVIKRQNPSLSLTINDIDIIVNNLCEQLKESVIDNYADEIMNKKRSQAVSTVRLQAKKIVDAEWSQNKIALVPGKKLIKSLSKICQDNYGVQLNAHKLAINLAIEEIDDEVKIVLSKIEQNIGFQ